MSAFFTAIGIVLSVFGVWQGLEALNVSPLSPDGQTANLLAMHIREATLQIACTAFLAGSLFICAAALLEKPSRSDPPV